MDVNRVFDYLIVGQGLAGSLLAWRLLRQRKQVLIIDSGSGISASLIAAGLVNPITGQRLVKTPKLDQYLSAAKRLYGELEDFFGCPFYLERPQIRLFINPKEQRIYEKRFVDSQYACYLGERFAKNGYRNDLAGELGGFHQKKCGYLNTVRLLNQLRNYFREKNAIAEGKLAVGDVYSNGTLYLWKSLKFKHIIFCEGFHAMNNPWFTWLPFQPVKGEILTLKVDPGLPAEIVVKGNWLLPLSNNFVKTGANYQRDKLDNKPTQKIAIELLNAFNAFYKKPPKVEIAKHQAGVRPATLDKQPFIGTHPRHHGFHIFNGFGSKGSLMIPWFSLQFTDYLLKGEPLPENVDITRYSTR